MFRLSRYYSIASLIGMMVIVVGLSLFLREVALQILLAQQTRSNVDLTRSYANAMWSQIKGLVDASEGLSPDALRHQKELAAIQKATQAQMKGMNVVKVKVYNLAGMTVFSTESTQIGDDKSTNPGFLSAKAGEARSEIVFRNQFYAIENVIVDRNLIATYMPIHSPDGGPVKAVFEVYTDVTPLVAKMHQVQTWIVAGVSVALLLLYLFLFIIVRRADRILTAQESERKQNEDQIRHQAFHDSLTGLPNRNSFNERISEAVARVRRHGKTGALLFLDLDRFKLINDSLGHDAGDQLLRVAASRIQKSLRETDLVFRLSGDEFTVILEDLDRVECAALAAQRILEAMTKPVLLGDFEVIVHISIGITIFSSNANNIEALVKEADSAMYRAKEIGHNQFVFYTKEMNTVAAERLSMQTDLQRAVQNKEFLLYYQPKIDTVTRTLVSVEALLRWRHPQRGIVPPNDFIPLLEDTGLINAVGEWVLMEATRQAQAWITQGFAATRMSVNVSGKQFRHPELIDTVRRALAASGLEPQYLELELTESMFIDNTERSIQTMKALKALGVSLSIDDFGSGYSSLAYLKQFPIDYLKIDRSFIHELASDSKDAAIVAAISALALSLNLKLVAEGVEEHSQVEFLERQGCHELQGFLFGRPMPPQELEASLHAQRSLTDHSIA